jgi:hypothetical protein
MAGLLRQGRFADEIMALPRDGGNSAGEFRLVSDRPAAPGTS